MEQDSIPLLQDGINTKLFEISIKESKLCYLIPDFHNPTSITYSKDNRKEVSRLIKENQALIIEDAPYSYLYFKEAFKSISEQVPQNSFHIGSFSKVLAPGLRLGWIRADESLLNPLIIYKETIDTHTDNLSQYIVADYLKDSNKFSSHLDKLRASYFKKMSNFARILDEILPQFQFSKPKGGMFIYGKIPGINTVELVQRCLKRNVVFVPGIEFSKKELSKDELRFNYTYCDILDIRKGVTIIKEEIEFMIKIKYLNKK